LAQYTDIELKDDSFNISEKSI